MKIKSIEKLAKIYEQIKQLDAEIIKIDEFVMKAVDLDTTAKLNLSFETKDESKKEESDHILDADDIHSAMRRMLYSFDTCNYGNSKIKTTSLEYTIELTTMLSVMGVLLAEKQSQRTALLNQIKQLGIEL